MFQITNGLYHLYSKAKSLQHYCTFCTHVTLYFAHSSLSFLHCHILNFYWNQVQRISNRYGYFLFLPPDTNRLLWSHLLLLWFYFWIILRCQIIYHQMQMHFLASLRASGADLFSGQAINHPKITHLSS